MSAQASFIKFRKNNIGPIRSNLSITTSGFILKKRIDQYLEYKSKHGQNLPDFEYSGWVYADLLEFIVDNIVDLYDSEYKSLADELSKAREATILIIDYDLAHTFIEKVKSKVFSSTELLEFHNKFTGANDSEEYGEIMLKGIEHLVKIFKLIDKESVILFEIA